MGLKDRIFQRSAEQEPADSAPEPADAGEQPVADEDLTVIQPAPQPAAAPELAAEAPQDQAEDQPTIIHSAVATETPEDADTAEASDAVEPDAIAEPTDEPVAEAEAPVAAPAAAPEGFVVDPGAIDALPRRPGFRERGRMRRRLRFLREVRELGFRDLGGLVFDQHRFQRPNEALVHGKVEAIDAVDREIRAIEAVLANQLPYAELFIPGVSACQRCGALHGSDARFCPNCGLAFAGPRTVAGMAPGQTAYNPAGTPSPGQAALFDPHTGAQVQPAPAPVQPPAPAPVTDAPVDEPQPQPDWTTGEPQQP